MSDTEYPVTETINYKSGQLKTKYKLVAYKNYESSESYYENGQKKLTYKRKEKSTDLHMPDVYAYEYYSDRGSILASGDCLIMPTEEFYVEGTCRRLTGVEKSYSKEGTLYSETRLTKGKLDGVSTIYEKEVTKVVTYKDNKKIKYEEKDPKSGKVLKTEEYFDDGSVKK